MFFLDCWLDKSTPCIRIVSHETGKNVLELKGAQVETVLEEHVIEINDLFNRNKANEDDIIMQLFLYITQDKNYEPQNTLASYNEASQQNKLLQSDTYPFKSSLLWLKKHWSKHFLHTFKRFSQNQAITQSS